MLLFILLPFLIDGFSHVAPCPNTHPFPQQSQTQIPPQSQTQKGFTSKTPQADHPHELRKGRAASPHGPFAIRGAWGDWSPHKKKLKRHGQAGFEGWREFTENTSHKSQGPRQGASGRATGDEAIVCHGRIGKRWSSQPIIDTRVAGKTTAGEQPQAIKHEGRCAYCRHEGSSPIHLRHKMKKGVGLQHIFDTSQTARKHENVGVANFRPAPIGHHRNAMGTGNNGIIPQGACLNGNVGATQNVDGSQGFDFFKARGKNDEYVGHKSPIYPC